VPKQSRPHNYDKPPHRTAPPLPLDDVKQALESLARHVDDEQTFLREEG
jgi:hypothetical protein